MCVYKSTHAMAAAFCDKRQNKIKSKAPKKKGNEQNEIK